MNIKIEKFNLPESFNQSDVIIEIPFKYGYINFYPYYKTGEIVLGLEDRNLILIDAVIKSAKQKIEETTEQDIYEYIFTNQKVATPKIFKYEFEYIARKLIEVKRTEKIKRSIIHLVNTNDYIFVKNEAIKFSFVEIEFILELTDRNDLELVYFCTKEPKIKELYIKLLKYKIAAHKYIGEINE